MEEIIRFVMLARSERFTLTDLCEQFGISRKTGYRHLARYAARLCPSSFAHFVNGRSEEGYIEVVYCSGWRGHNVARRENWMGR
jgi:DNA polymerase III epsilon subunit-like protein